MVMIITRQIKSVCAFTLVMLFLCGMCCTAAAGVDENSATVLTFNPGTGSGDAYTQTHASSPDGWFVLNPSAFTAPAGQEFIGWIDESGTFYTDKQAVNLTGTPTLTAQWAAVTPWDGTSAITAAGYYQLSDNTKVTETISVNATDGPVVIDLNGFVLDGGGLTGVLDVKGGVVTLTDTSQNKVHYFSVEGNQIYPDSTRKDIWKLCDNWGAKPADAASANTIALKDILKHDDWNNSRVKYVTVPGGCITNGTGLTIDGDPCGGGAYIGPDSVFTINGGYIAGNTALFGGGMENDGMLTINGGGIVGNCAVYPDSSCDVGCAGSGGGIYNCKGTAVLDGGCIVGNTAKTQGGGFRDDNGLFIMFSGRVDANAAGLKDDNSNDGGGVHLRDDYYHQILTTFIMYGGSVSGNTAAGHGGGIHNEEKTIIYGGTIAWNTALRGAGVNNRLIGDLTIYGGDISHNSAELVGGGVRNSYGFEGTDEIPMTHIHGGNISCNRAGYWGGGIINVEGELEIDETSGPVTISHNYAGELGGGIDNNDNGTLVIRGGSITDNESGGYGGGIDNYSSGVGKETGTSMTGADLTLPKSGKPTNMTITGGIIERNHAAWTGGGVYMYYGDIEGGSDCDLYVSGSPVIRNNTSDELGGTDNVYLETWDEQGLQRYITLVGPMGTDAEVHVSYPLTTGTEKWFFGVVKDGYSATEEDLTHFHADSDTESLSPIVAEDGKTLIWKETPKPAQSGASPAPLAGVTAGLGAAFAAAFVCRRK